ncbi:MAG: thiolase domain-containing protein, partial [Candidatus Bathyarchaeia archaeon]
MRKAAIIGIGCTKIGELWNKSLKDLLAESATASLNEAGIDRIDAIYVGNMGSEVVQDQSNLGALVCDCLGIDNVPALRIEAAGASGAAALAEGVKSVSSGSAECVLVAGAEKMTDAVPTEASRVMMTGEDPEYVAYSGISAAGLHALITRLYSDKYEVSPDQIAMMPVNAHKNATNNEFAQFHNLIEVDDVLHSGLVSDPIRLLECASLSDGAASLIICPLETARKFSDSPVEILASEIATDSLSLPERQDLLTFNASTWATSRALANAKIKIEDVNVLEVHDEAAITGIMAIEDMGFAQKGRGAAFVADGNIAIEGTLPTNTMGGFKGRGNPVGA